VSSTFTDLIDERAEVIQALWELDCIPTGMEAFVASNESQWDVIRRVIDECDYYVLIIGGRYGSVTEDGISYTEKEYRYAKQLQLPVLAFVHGNPEQIPAGKSEKDENLRKKLEEFRREVMAEHPVRSWSSASELGGLVSRSLVRETRLNPRPGWIRNDGSSPIALLEQINALTEENRELREAASQVALDSDDAGSIYESGEDTTYLSGMRKYYHNGSHYRQAWEASTTWNNIFRVIGPSLISETEENALQELLAEFHWHHPMPKDSSLIGKSEISSESWSEVLIQFRALGYIDTGLKKRAVSDRGRYWRITPRGDRHLVSLLARKRGDASKYASVESR
jgi:hypothetical protein